MKNKNWIISKYQDLFGISFSGIFILILLMTINSKLDAIFFIYAILIISIIDQTHVYITLNRIIKEFNINKNYFIITPILIFLTVFFWIYLKIPYFMNILLYFAIFHFIKQIFGINRWYLWLNKTKSKILDYILVLIMIVPIIAMHFRSNFKGVEFIINKNSLFLFPNENLLLLFFFINLIIILTWIIYEIIYFLKNKRIESGRIIFIISNIILFSIICYKLNNPIIILISILFAHSIQYILISIKFEKSIYKKINFKKFLILPVSLSILELIGYYVLPLNFYYMILKNYNFFNSFLIALILTPLLTHYIIDMKIWKSSWIKRIK